MKAELGGNGKNDPSLYSVKFATDPTQGITYYDNNLDLSFTMVPEFKVLGMRESAGRIVYSLPGGVQVAYTPKDNGLKEDLLLNSAVGSSVSYQYKLVLPDTLEAQVIASSGGEVGIYSADPALYGTINYGSSTDQATVMKDRVSSPKTNLVFIVPAPSIKQASTSATNPQATAQLAGTTFTVNVTHLPSSGYPLDIDPSVVISGASGFAAGGNNEDGISFTTGINRSGLTGGSLASSWTTSANSLAQALFHASSVVYNGYVYELGGSTGGTNSAAVYYATLNSGGSISAWTSTTALPTGLYGATSVAYDGYIYELGGKNSAGTTIATTYYAPLNANGTIGTWTATTAMTQTEYHASSVVYNGYIYELGGVNNAGTGLATTYYAPLNANGTIGTWTATTVLPVTLYYSAAAIYNGYVYTVAGSNSGTTIATTYYAPLNANGTIGTWTSSTALPIAVYADTAVVSNGYIYEFGGTTNGTDYQTISYYAPLNANGTIGTWTAGTALPQGLRIATSVTYNGYIYEIAGQASTGNPIATTYYIAINAAGVTGSYTSTTALSIIDQSSTSVAYNGYIYEIAGYSSTWTANTYYASLNASTGAIGTWTATTAVPVALRYATSVVYNGYVYEIGGYNASSAAVATTYYAPLNASTGAIGTWTATTALPVALYTATSAVYNGYIYELGGENSSSALVSTTYYAPLSSTGTIGTWTSTTALSAATVTATTVVNSGYIYELGGATGAGYVATTYYAPLNTNGTIGTWTATTVLTQALAQATSIVYNGYLYELGGYNSGGYQSTVYDAPFNSNGSIGSWSTITALTVATRQATSVVYNGYLYELGGQASSGTLSTTYYAQINNGGTGTAGSWTTNSPALTAAVYNSTSDVYNGYLYELGGYNGSGVTTTYYAPINSNGSIGTITATTVLPAVLYHATSAVYNGYIYILGGTNGTSNQSTTYYAPLNTNGTIGTWTSTTALPVAISYSSSAVYNGYIYELGGSSSTTIATTYYAPLNTNGTIGTWTSTTALPVAFYGAVAAINNGRVYVMGGNNGSVYLATTYYAPLNTNGTIGTWTATTVLPQLLYGASANIANGYIYVLGGYNGTVQLTDYYAPLNANGTIGTWTATTALPAALYFSTSVVYNGYMYNLGGYSGSAASAAIYYTPLSVIPRVAQYSTLINLGALASVTGLAYVGTLPGGVSALSYRTAGSNGVFGSVTNAISLIGASQCVTAGQANYAWLSVSLNDVNNSVFPEVSSSGNANLTSLTLTYMIGAHPQPNQRLRGGMTLQSGVLSQLDTCGT
jgi:N-acetylneuraminic acid mutarotase